jgi:hypothetical protein
MCNALDLLEYWRRVNRLEEQAAKTGKTPVEMAEAEEQYPARLPSEQQMEGQFGALTQIMSGPGGANAQVSKIPEHLREAIRWAEEEKGKRGMSRWPTKTS